MMLLRLDAFCCVCKTSFDWHTRYGRDGCCCSKDCYGDFNLRYAISLGLSVPQTTTPGATAGRKPTCNICGNPNCDNPGGKH